jgi:uncharacterized protein YybS (DUF2232 family)
MPSTPSESTARERIVLVILTVVTAVFGTLLSSMLFVAPVPLAVLICRHGLRAGIATALVAALSAGAFMQHPAAVLLVLLVLGLGVAIGEALRDGLSLNQTLAVAWAAAFLAFAALYGISRLVFQIDLIDATVQLWLDQLVRLAGRPGGVALSEAELAEFSSHLKSILPGMMALSSGGIAFFDYWLTGRWLVRLGMEVPWFAPFARWRFPWYFTWGYIAGLGLPLLQGLLRAPWLIPVSANLELVFRFVFLLQGVAVLWFYLTRWGVRRFIAVLLIMISFLAGPLLVFVGLLDAWFDLRRLGSS